MKGAILNGLMDSKKVLNKKMNNNLQVKNKKYRTPIIDLIIIFIFGSSVYLFAVSTNLHEIIDRWAGDKSFAGLKLDELFVLLIFLGVAFSFFGIRRWREVNYEITEHKRLQKALGEEIARTRNYLNIAGVMLVVMNAEGKVTLINRKGCKILGYDESEIVGKNWFDTFIPERIKQDLKAVFTELMSGNVSPVEYFENPVLTKSGEEKIIAWHNMILMDEKGNITETLSSGEDITEHRHAEEALGESEEKFRSVAQSAIDTIISVDSSGNIIFWNRAAEKLFGYSVDEAIGKPLTIIMPERFHDAYKSRFQRIVSGGESRVIGTTVNLEGLKKEGSEFPVELTLSKWETKKGIFFTGIVRDITVRKLTDEQLVKQSAEAKERNLELSTLYKISFAIGRTIDLNELFSSILNTITELDILKVERKGGIFIVQGDNMTLVSHLGHPESFLDKHKGMKVGDCLCGLAAKTGEIIVSNNATDDSCHTIEYPDITPHGHIVIPLKVANRVLGVLYLYTPCNSEVDEKTINMLIAIGNQIGIAIDNAMLYEQTKALSLQDPLTKLANRNLMNVELEKNFARSKRFETPLSIIIMDLDNFKNYNDTHGHIAGDKLLVETANIVTNEVRTIDLVVRYGGEEFLIILPDTEITKACEVAERIRKTIETTTGITISLGISAYQRGKMQKVHDVLKKADDALYQAKQKGKNRVEVSD